MTLDVKNPISLDALDNALRNAQGPSLDLLSKIIADACTRIPTSRPDETVLMGFYNGQGANDLTLGNVCSFCGRFRQIVSQFVIARITVGCVLQCAAFLKA